MITALPDSSDYVEPPGFAGVDHPMRKVTREVAFDGQWTPERAAKVAELFNSMASEWAARHRDGARISPVADALERGSVDHLPQWLELGSGTGAGTSVIAHRVDFLVCCDLAREMLLNAPADLAPQVQADASRLPFAADAFAAVLMVNMILFPGEVDRVLAPRGKIVWVNTMGDQTPIHLSPDDVAAALPGKWRGVTARAGSGFWAVFERV